MADKKANISADQIKATRLAGGKRMIAVKDGLVAGKAYSVDEAVKIIKSRAKAKFDETIEIAMTLGVDPKHADQMVRGVCNLPNGSGRTARVAVFAKGAKADEARAAGADLVGADDLVEQHSLFFRAASVALIAAETNYCHHRGWERGRPCAHCCTS